MFCVVNVMINIWGNSFIVMRRESPLKNTFENKKGIINIKS